MICVVTVGDAQPKWVLPGSPSWRLDMLTPCFWPEAKGETERFIRHLADGMLAHGHRPRLITSHPGGFSRRVEDGLEIVRVPRFSEARLRRRLFEEHLTHLPLSYAVLRLGDAQLAHAFNPGDGAVAGRWSRQTGRPALFSYMGVPDHAELTGRRRRLELIQSAIAASAATVACSRYAAAEFRRWLGVEVEVIYPGVELSSSPVGAKRSEAPTIVCPATAGKRRGWIGLLVEAHRIVRRTHPQARLLLDGSCEKGVSDPENGIETVSMDDPRTRADLIGRAWAAAVPFLGEAFSVRCVQVLAAGTPVLASARGAFPEIIDAPELGRLLEDSSAQALAVALLEVLEKATDPVTRSVCRARAECFSTAGAVAEYERLYGRLIGSSSSASVGPGRATPLSPIGR